MQNNRRHDELDSSLLELRDLLADFATGELTSEQDARLQQVAIKSKAAWRLYIHYMFMYGTIQRKHCNREKVQDLFTSLFGDIDEEPPTTPPASNNSIFPLLEIEKDLLAATEILGEFGVNIPSNADDAPSGGIFENMNFSFVPGLITLVSAILILSVVVVLPIYWSLHSKELAWDIVARVNQTIDCQWKENSAKPTTGSFLATGQKLELELGLAELEFASGARVILQGPAEFTITGKNSSDLALGRLAATVPEGAQGFTVETPNMEIIDLGTEFGVEVEEDGNTDVHVFKGLVETKVTKPPTPEKERKVFQPKKRERRLKRDQAARYNKTSNDIVSIPFDKKKFVRSLDRNGVTANLNVTNPSFELPSIQNVPEYQSVLGCTLLRPIYGWKVSDPDPSKPRVAKYQISPYKSPNANCNVGPRATDGRQVAVLSLGIKPSPAGKPRSSWLYQSLGIVTSADVNKKLKLTVDAGPRSDYGVNSQGNGTVYAAFALQVNAEQCGKLLGKPGSFSQKGEIKQLHQLEATVTITQKLVGQELFILLAANEDSNAPNACQYHFDNVKVVEE